MNLKTNSVDFFSHHKIIPPGKDSELILAVWDIGNPGNMGHIIRLGHNVGAKKILFIKNDTDFRESKIKKTAGFSYEQMNWSYITETDFIQLLNDEFRLVVLETSEGSRNIFDVTLPEKTILLGGNESHGLPSHIIDLNNISVHIPMPGGCKSMNISHALSVAAFEWYRQNMDK